MFSFPVRVYYEDTDCSGRVYHACYLKFLERARTEFLRHKGLTHHTLEAFYTPPLPFFAVHHMEITFKGAAVLDDTLNVQTIVAALTAARLKLNQTIFKEDTEILEASVTIALLQNGRPLRWTEALKSHFQEKTAF